MPLHRGRRGSTPDDPYPGSKPSPYRKRHFGARSEPIEPGAEPVEPEQAKQEKSAATKRPWSRRKPAKKD